MHEARMAEGLKPSSKIAIGVGSRGIANMDVIAGAVVAWWKDQGMQPFLFPAMGSHGSATAKGQADVLAHYGISETTMGCPVRSSLAVVDLGQTPEGIPTFMDRNAHRADKVMLCGRVKWHTDFAGEIESGLFKMMAIGIGKVTGAKTYHTFAYRIGMEAVIRSVGRQVLGTGKILGGLAILEDGNHDTGHLAAVRAEEMETKEPELLALAKSWMARIPVSPLDVLVVNEMGKNISGTGMDSKVINRDPKARYNPWPGEPIINRVLVRDLSLHSYGNAIGIGMADVIHSRLLKRVNKRATYVNAFTSGSLAAGRIPASFPSDRDCLEALWSTVGKLDPQEVTLGWIRNTQDLSLLAFTDNLLPAIEANPNLEVLGPARELEFDERGDLVDWFEIKTRDEEPSDRLSTPVLDPC